MSVPRHRPARRPDSLSCGPPSTLSADFAASINRSRWLRNARGERLHESLGGRLEELEDRLEQLDVAREYFKTIYVRKEIADLSRAVFYTGLLAVAVAVTFLPSVGYPAAVPPSAARSLVVALAVTINFGPLAVPFSHVLRVATVARRTAAISPFGS